MPKIAHSFADMLRRAKKRHSLTNSTLAARLNISIKTLEQWLKGDRAPLAITQEGALARLGLLLKPEGASRASREAYAQLISMTRLSMEEYAFYTDLTEDTIALRLGGALPITAEAMLTAERIAQLATNYFKAMGESRQAG